MVSLHTETAKFKWVGHKNEFCFLRNTLVDTPLSVYVCSCISSDSLKCGNAPQRLTDTVSFVYSECNKRELMPFGDSIYQLGQQYGPLGINVAIIVVNPNSYWLLV